jgi:protein gp37
MADLFGKWVPDHWIEEVFQACNNNPQWRYIFLTKFPSRYKELTFPPQSCVGASVDTQRRADIIAHSMQHVTAEVRWLSIEPLLEPIVFADGVLDDFDWVVIGAQTTANGIPAFSPHFEWVASIVAQARKAGCKVHLKPNLLTTPGMQLPDEYPAPLTGNINE